MTIDLTGALKRKKRTASKRLLGALHRVHETVLSEVQGLHAKAAYEDALDRLASEVDWQNDSRT